MLCSLMIKCTEGRERIIRSFPEQTMVAWAYHGKLLGLVAIHLILLAANKANPHLPGCTRVISGCLGALGMVSNLPSNRIPMRCKHSDILKNIMINCSDLIFDLDYSHVRAHQDYSVD